MGGGKKAKAPAAPDYAAIAQQQGQENRAIAQELTNANRPNQSDIYGNTISWSQGPNGAWSQNVQLSGPMQQRLEYDLVTQDRAREMYRSILGDSWAKVFSAQPQFGQGQYQNLPQSNFQSPNTTGQTTGANFGVGGLQNNQANTGVNLGNYGVNQIGQGATNTGVNLTGMGSQQIGQWQGNTGVNMNNFGATGIGANVPNNVPQYDPNSGKSVADALYGSVMDRARVEQQRETDTLTTQLRQQGLQPGTEAFDRAMKNLRTSQNDANLLAAQNATLAGGQEARDIFGAQLAGNQQKFGQLVGMNDVNLQRAGFQNQMNQQNFQNLLGLNEANLQRAMAQQGMNQQGYQNQLSRLAANSGLAQLQQGMNQQNFQNLLGVQSNNRANWQMQNQANNDFFNQQLQSAQNARENYESALRGQGQSYGQALGNRNQNLQELGFWQGMAGNTPGTQFQGFGTATGYSPADMLGAANASYAARMGGYNSQNAKKGGLLGSGLALGGSLLGGK